MESDIEIAPLWQLLQHMVGNLRNKVWDLHARAQVHARHTGSLLLISLFGVLLLVSILGAIVGRLHSERETILVVEMRNTNSVAAAFSEYTRRELRDIDRTATVIKAQFERDGRVDLPYLLRTKLIPSSAPIRISVTDRRGDVIASNRQLTTSVNVADRDFFRRLVAGNGSALDISQAAASPGSDRPALYLSRRLDLGDGTFGGVVVVAIDPAYLTTFYDQSPYRQHGMLAILGLNGVYRMRRSGDRIYGGIEGRATPLFAAAMANGEGSYIGDSVIDPRSTLITYRKMDEYPLIVAVNEVEGEVLANYEQRRALHLIAGTAVSLIVILFFAIKTIVAYRARRTTNDVRRRMEFLRALFHNMPLGVVARSLKGADRGRIVVWNPVVETIFSVPAAAALGKTIGEILPAEFAAEIEERDQTLLEHRVVQEVPQLKTEVPHGVQRVLGIVHAPILDERAEVEYVVTIIQDVTGAQANVDALRLSAKVFETTADAIVISDVDDRVVAVNAAFTRFTGFAPDEMLGKRVTESPFRPSDPGEFATRQKTLLEEGCVTAEVLRYRKDGSPLACWLTKTFVRDDTGAIINYVRVFSDISALKDAHATLMSLAQLDVLTALPNRRLFNDRLRHALERAQRAGQSVGLLFIDLDHFKAINDEHGHGAGDVVLKEVARRLKECVRASDSLCRIGGDEFTVVMEGTKLLESTQQVGERVIWALDPPIDIGSKFVNCRASIGIALYPEHGDNAETLLRRADMAMYQAKHAGRERCVMASVSTPVTVLEEKRVNGADG